MLLQNINSYVAATYTTIRLNEVESFTRSYNTACVYFNTFRPRQNGHYFQYILKCILLNKNV